MCLTTVPIAIDHTVPVSPAVLGGKTTRTMGCVVFGVAIGMFTEGGRKVERGC